MRRSSRASAAGILVRVGIAVFLIGFSLSLLSLQPAKVPAEAYSALAPLSGKGAIWTTLSTCGPPQNVNHYNIGDHIYINGDNFAPGQSVAWYIEGKPGGASCDSGVKVAQGTATADSDGRLCFSAYIVASDDCGEYQVKAEGAKGDNYRVEGATATPTEVPPTEVPPTEVPPTEVPPTEVPPTEVPPTEVPPTEVPPTEVPPTEVPPTEVPPTEVPPTEVPPTEVPPTSTPVPPTSTPVPPTSTPTNTPVPPTSTPVPPTSTPVPPTSTPVPPAPPPPPPPPTSTPLIQVLAPTPVVEVLAPALPKSGGLPVPGALTVVGGLLTMAGIAIRRIDR